MSTSEQNGRFALGPGNEILDKPQNAGLLAQIAEAAPLNTGQLLELARFYGGYPGTSPLGKHSALVGLANAAGQQAVQQIFVEYNIVEEGLEYATYFYDPDDDSGARVAAPFTSFHVDTSSKLEASGSPDAPVVSFQISLRRVTVDGIGLLIETYVSTDTNRAESKRHFIIGVSPV